MTLSLEWIREQLGKVSRRLVSHEAEGVHAGLNIDSGTLYVDSANNRVGIGTTSPAGGPFHVQATDVGNSPEIARFVVTNVGGGTGTPIIRLCYFEGSFLESNDGCGRISFEGSLNGVNAQGVGGYIQVAAQGNWSATSSQSYMVFATTSSGAIAATERFRIDALGNLGVATSTFPTSATRHLVISTGTEGSDSPADSVSLYSVDLSAGNATLGLRTETAVAADVLADSTHSLTVRINGTSYKIMLVAV